MICPLPFREFQVKPSGDVYCCCEDWLPTPIGNILEEAPSEIWNSQTAREIRASVCHGDFRFCTRCPFLPGPAGPVSRERPIPPAKQPSVIRLDYLRGCNLRCPSCRKQAHEDLHAGQVHEAVLVGGVLDSAEFLCASGAGDPVADPSCWDLLCNLHHVVPKNPGLEVKLYTNGLLLDERRWSELGPTRQKISEIGFSIDAGTEDTYAKNRGGSWQRLWHDVDLARWMSGEAKNFKIDLYFVLQANNFRELPGLLEMARDHGLDLVHVFFLRNWGTFASDEYERRAVHHPSHPEHGELARTIERSRKDPRLVLPTFPPRPLPEENEQ